MMQNGNSNVVEFPTLRDPQFPVHKAADILEPYLRAIVDKVRPEKIILFGSYAYGQPTEHSDFDLLVIRRGIRTSKESNMEIRRAIRDVDAPPQSFTFLSATPEEFDFKANGGSFVYEDIAQKGVVVYAA
jgi:predicted nucleotidyltransferase